MEILNLYFTNKRENLFKNYDEKQEEIKKTDKYEIERRKCADMIDKLYKELNEGKSYYDTHSKVFKWAEGKLQTKETIDKLNELEEKLHEELTNLRKMEQEIYAQLSLCETYEQKMTVLRNYNIIDENGLLVK